MSEEYLDKIIKDTKRELTIATLVFLAGSALVFFLSCKLASWWGIVAYFGCIIGAMVAYEVNSMFGRK